MFAVFQSELTDDSSEIVQGFSTLATKGKKTRPYGITGFKFKGVRFWNMSFQDLDEVRTVWERTVQVIREGVALERTPKGMANNLPKASESRVAHVRPHGRDASDCLYCYDQSFSSWLFFY